MTALIKPADATPLVPAQFGAWFAKRGWAPRPHQLQLLAKARAGKSVLLIAPTGAGKTLAGFLPSLVDLAEKGVRRSAPKPGEPVIGPHTLYVSPLKALAVDIHRNLEMPVAEMGLPIRLETRTGDTPVYKRQRQKLDPPDILLTTPEQVALLLASKDARRFFKRLKTVIFDELHSLVVSKRGDLLSLDLARLRKLAPGLTTIGLSATVAEPDDLCAWLVAQEPDAAATPRRQDRGGRRRAAGHLDHRAGRGARAVAGAHGALRAPRDLRGDQGAQDDAALRQHALAGGAALPGAVAHQRRLARRSRSITARSTAAQRRKVEAAMAEGKLRAVVATSTLDLGIDWGDVDLVVHVGAPKGASRLAQRIGRANHRMDEPSKGILVPSNRFEVLECRAALDANYLGHQDTPPLRAGTLDVLCQHILGMAVAEPFDAVALYDEITSAEPYRDLPWETFERCVDFVATGGYALRTYERYAKIRRRKDGLLGRSRIRASRSNTG